MTENERLVHVEDRAKSNTHRIESLEERMDKNEELVTSVALIADRQGKMEVDVSEMKGDIKTLIEKPAKRWDSVVEKVLLAIVTALVAFCLAKIGL